MLRAFFNRAKPARVEPSVSAEYVDVPSSDAVKMGEIFALPKTDSGAVVNESTAMRVSAVYRCVGLIAGAVATLPCTFYRRTADGRERANHDYWWLFNEAPNLRFTAAAFWEFSVGQMLLRGDGIAYMVRRDRYSPTIDAVIPVHRDKVTILRVGDQLSYTITDTLADGSIGQFTAHQDDVLHFPGLGFDGVSSKSVIGWAARQSIGIAIKADEHTAQVFGNGAHLQWAVKAPGKMSAEQKDAFREAWIAKYSGAGVSRAPLVLTEGLDITQLSMNAVDAQLLESRRFQVVDIARAFGVPPHMIGETTAATSWGSGIEQMSIGFVKYTLQPHLARIEQEMNRKLFPRSSRYFVEFNVDGQLSGDSKTQAEYFGKALGGPGSQGWMTVNEVRRLKNLPPIAGGDELVRSSTGDPNAPNAEPPQPAAGAQS